MKKRDYSRAFFSTNPWGGVVNKTKGFTLIELMIVVAIIGILAAIAVPQYQTYIAKSQVTRVMSEAGYVKSVVELCISDGKTPMGTGRGECNLYASGSNLINGLTQSNQIAANTGVAQVEPLAIGITPTVTAIFGNAASMFLQTSPAGNVVWTRSAAGSWSCTTNVDAKYKPSGCL
jgi:type IV pilus assembly protein PilA